jgi:hypothetical protein
MKLDTHQAFSQDLIQRKGFDNKTLFMKIGPEDDMYYRAILPGLSDNADLATYRYFESATRMFDIYKQVANHLGGFSNLGPVLDAKTAARKDLGF